MNLIELTTSLTNETFIVNLDHIAAIKKTISPSENTEYATIILSSGQSIPISETDFNRIIYQLTNQYNLCVIDEYIED